MVKKFLRVASGIAACILLFGAQATAQSSVPIAVTAAYSKDNSQYDVVVKDTSGTRLVLYVNDGSPSYATVNKKDWATFHKVKLVDNGKVSFTKQLKGKNDKTYQRPINYVRYANISNGQVSFTNTQEAATAPASSAAAPATAPTPAPAPTPTCTNGTYVNSAGNTVCSPESGTTAPAGATAQCVDGTYSFSQSRSGTCSHHGGVAQWL